MKMKLPFLQLEKEFVQIISPEDLKQIVGGTYGGPTASWTTSAGILENINGMMMAGVFDYYGSANTFEGNYSLDSLSGSGSIPFTINTFMGSIGSIPPTPRFTMGSSGLQGLWFGSAIGSVPGALNAGFGSFGGSFVAPGAQNPTLNLTYNNQQIIITVTPTSFGVKLKL